MTIEQAQDAAELLKHRNKIKAIQSRMKADKTLVVCMSNGRHHSQKKRCLT